MTRLLSAIRIGAFGLVAAIFVAAPVLAQDTNLQSLIDRMARLERDLSSLQRQVYRGNVPPAQKPAPGSDVLLPRDTGSAVAEQQVRIARMEEELRSLTGKIEESEYATRQIGEKLDKLAVDLDQRLAALERRDSAGAPMAGVAPTPGAAPAPGAPPVAGGGVTGTQGSEIVVGRDPNTEQYDTLGVLGTVGNETLGPAPSAPPAPSEGEAQAQAQVAAAVAVPVAPASGAQAEYDAAYALLAQAQYGPAEAAFTDFVGRHPDSPLIGAAYYWLGETHYVRNSFDATAKAFARGYKADPKGNKAPDNLLKMGTSLVALGKTEQACATFTKLAGDHPDAPQQVKDRTQRERSKAGCP